MKAQFVLTDPGVIELTLTLTDSLGDWQTLAGKLTKGEHSLEAVELGRRIAQMVSAVTDRMTAEQWATPYSTGTVERSEQQETGDA